MKAFLAAFVAAATLAAGMLTPTTAVPRPAAAAATTTPLPSRTPPRHIPPANWTVLPLGDSITLGVASTDGTGYRGPLHALLPTLTFVGSQGAAPLLHEGHSGWRIDQLLAIAPGILTTFRPAFVLLHAGTNDTVQGFPASTMLTNMAALLDAIHTASPGTVTYVALISITPYAGAAQQGQEAAFNAGIPALAAARQPWVTVVDVRLQASDLKDGVHPNDTGYAKMAQLWAAALPEVRAS